MDLSGILDDEKPAAVSTGKIVGMTCDPVRGDAVDHVSKLCDKLPYVARAVAYVNEQGFSVVETVRQALLGRAEGKKVCTLHEADIALRSKCNFGSSFVQTALSIFGGYLTEDDCNFSNGIFQARARYNKGMNWYKEWYDKVDHHKRKAGLDRLSVIAKELEIAGLPLHDEERAECINPEFLKPEYMSWDVFSRSISLCMQNEPMVQRDEREQRQAEAARLATA